MKFKSNETDNELGNAEKEILSLRESIEIQLGLAKLALESAEKSLNSLFNLFNEDNC